MTDRSVEIIVRALFNEASILSILGHMSSEVSERAKTPGLPMDKVRALGGLVNQLDQVSLWSSYEFEFDETAGMILVDG